MKIFIRNVLVGVGAVLTLGTATACSSSSEQAETTSTETTSALSETTSTTAAAMPKMATFIAQMPTGNDYPMGLTISVDGDQIAAYACNGTDDEVWFFGTQADGVIDLTSRLGDTMTATYDGTQLAGTLTMDEQSYPFGASVVSEPAGLYTATADGERATWIVMADGTTLGVLNRHFDEDDRALKESLERQQDLPNQVRQIRLQRQLQQAPPLNMTTMEANINSTKVRATRVTGSTRFS